MRKLVTSYLPLLIVVLFLTACEPGFIKKVKVTVPVFSQTHTRIEARADLLDNVLKDIDGIADNHGIKRMDNSATGRNDPLIIRVYRVTNNYKHSAAPVTTTIIIRGSKDNSYLDIHYSEWMSRSQTQLSKNIERDVNELLTHKYGLNYMLQK